MSALLSPGVKVSIVDESIGGNQLPSTIPFIMIATGSNKQRPDGQGIAEGTLPQNSEVLYTITSQRELLQTFGEPAFMSVGGRQLHGHPLNEYGLLTAYSYLGISNRALVMRADIDLNQLQESTTEPTQPVSEGTYWLDTDDTTIGLHMLDSDPIDPSEMVWTPVSINVAFVGSSDDSVGSVGDHGMLVEEINGIQQISLIRKESDGWINLYEVQQGGVDVELVSSNVYPSTSSYSLTTGAYWLKINNSGFGTNISFRVMNNTGRFEDINVPLLNIIPSRLADGSFHALAKFTTGSESNIVINRVSNSISAPFSQYVTSNLVPTTMAVDGTYWYNSDVGLNANGESTVDILINSGTGSWDNIILPGFPSASMNGSTTSIKLYNQSLDPTTQVGVTVNSGDLWIDSADMDNYPAIYRYRNARWVAVDKTDQTTPNGVIFGDARPRPDSTISGTGGSGLNNGGGTSPNLDMDTPDPDAYPAGMLLFNTRYSTMNVKQWKQAHPVFADSNNIIQTDGRWVSVSGSRQDGRAYFGPDAQKRIVIDKMASTLVSNEEIRSEVVEFNLIAAPGFVELIDEMITLTTDRKETALVVGDSPFNLRANGTDITNWANNRNMAPSNGDEGLLTSDYNLAVYYPSGLSTNLDGSEVVVPSSHMALRTIAFNDQVAYPWMAPAGLQRGRVTNAVSLGYLDDEDEYVPVTLSEGLRDALYTSNINPINFIPNSGLVVYGQKTRSGQQSALDRVNVSRLIHYIRVQADKLARPFLFEPNDQQTRDAVTDTFNKFLAELITLRALSDFIVVCDTSNNTPIRIDRNELWIDIAIAPVRSVEFIYIPIRITNTGAI